MISKRTLWHNRKHWWHLSTSKAHKLSIIFEKIEIERVEPYKVELQIEKVNQKR